MQPEKLSPLLQSVVADAAGTAPERPLRVLVMLRKAPDTAIDGAMRRPNGRETALNALESAGVNPGILEGAGISPRHVYATLQTAENAQPDRVEPVLFLGGAALEVTPKTLDELTDSDSVEAVVEEHEHRVHLDV